MRKPILSQKELKHLAEVIGEMEDKTIGEIRVMIVKRSAMTGHVHNTLWVFLLALSFLLFWFERHDLIYFERWWLWPSLVIGTYLVANILARSAFVQRAFTPSFDLHHQVLARAEVEFHREGLSGTKAHTGVLIFLSLMERVAVVLADKGIADKVPVHGWDKVIAKVLAGARKGWADKLEEAIRECGAYLAAHFPSTGAKADELPNTVILKE
jgi:putative membrane protein